MGEVEHLEFLDHTATRSGKRMLSWGTVVLLAGFLTLAVTVGLQLARQNATQRPADRRRISIYSCLRERN